MARNLGFCRKFDLDLVRLASALTCVEANPDSGHEGLAHCMGVNLPVATGFSAWLRHCGLVTATSPTDRIGRLEHVLTEFGKLVTSYDQALAHNGTLWLLHYYLATEHEERSEAWYVLFNEYLRPGTRFSLEEYRSYFASTAGTESENRGAVREDPKRALNTYVRFSALGRLGLLSYSDKMYIAGTGVDVPPLIVAYMLFDWWQRHYPGSDTLPFPLLCQEPGSIGRVCLASDAQVRRWVEILTGMGYLTFSDSQHQPVNRAYHGSLAALLQRFYEEL